MIVASLQRHFRPLWVGSGRMKWNLKTAVVLHSMLWQNGGCWIAAAAVARSLQSCLNLQSIPKLSANCCCNLHWTLAFTCLLGDPEHLQSQMLVAAHRWQQHC